MDAGAKNKEDLKDPVFLELNKLGRCKSCLTTSKKASSQPLFTKLFCEICCVDVKTEISKSQSITEIDAKITEDLGGSVSAKIILYIKFMRCLFEVLINGSLAIKRKWQNLICQLPLTPWEIAQIFPGGTGLRNRDYVETRQKNDPKITTRMKEAFLFWAAHAKITTDCHPKRYHKILTGPDKQFQEKLMDEVSSIYKERWGLQLVEHESRTRNADFKFPRHFQSYFRVFEPGEFLLDKSDTLSQFENSDYSNKMMYERYRKWCLEKGDTPMCQRYFKKAKPFYVLRGSESDRQHCVCSICANFKELKYGCELAVNSGNKIETDTFLVDYNQR